MNNIPNISKGTWIRTIILAITLLNTVLVMFAQSPLAIDEAQVNEAVSALYAAFSAIAVIAASIAAWWKNNDFTNRARKNKKKNEKTI